jgi:hypothetical protein
MLTPFETQQILDRQARERVFKAQAQARDAAPPPHSAAEGLADLGEAGEDERRRERIRHADPYPPDAPEVAHADLGKRFTDAIDVPTGYPPMRPVSAEMFRDGPVTADHASYGAAYEASPRVVPVATATVSAAAITRPLLTDGRSRDSAPGGLGC